MDQLGMNALLILTLLLTAVLGSAVVLVRDLIRQALILGLFGFVLALLFLLLQAPGVALAQAIVSGIILPLLLLFAIAKVQGGQG